MKNECKDTRVLLAKRLLLLVRALEEHSNCIREARKGLNIISVISNIGQEITYNRLIDVSKLSGNKNNQLSALYRQLVAEEEEQ